jgi:hypothetical protein
VASHEGLLREGVGRDVVGFSFLSISLFTFQKHKAGRTEPHRPQHDARLTVDRQGVHARRGIRRGSSHARGCVVARRSQHGGDKHKREMVEVKSIVRRKTRKKRKEQN